MGAVPKRRPGRPFKPPTLGERAQISVLVRAEIKDYVASTAEASGWSQSQVVEALIERCLAYDRAFDAMKTTPAEIDRSNFDAELRRRGYTLIARHGAFKLWAEPGYPAERSGFLEPEEEEKK